MFIGDRLFGLWIDARTWRTKMKTYEFTIVASGLDPKSDDFEQRFLDAGCDDATISLQKGHIIVDFARESGTAEDAIASAVEAVRAAGATVDRVEPDPLVNLSDIAARTGMTRAAISQYVKGQRGCGGFPAPVARVTTDSPLWDWVDVSRWLLQFQRIERDVLLTALVVSEANKLVAERCGNFGVELKKRAGGYGASA